MKKPKRIGKKEEKKKLTKNASLDKERKNIVFASGTHARDWYSDVVARASNWLPPVVPLRSAMYGAGRVYGVLVEPQKNGPKKIKINQLP